MSSPELGFSCCGIRLVKVRGRSGDGQDAKQPF